MAKCKHHDVCRRDADPNMGDGLCILHSAAAGKGKKAFDKALEVHRKENGDNFSYFVFPDEVHFGMAEFHEDARFLRVKFTQDANFVGAKFNGIADFQNATFSRGSFFHDARFDGVADFGEVSFGSCPLFMHTQFSENAHFSRAKFTGGVCLNGANFAEDAFFRNATLSGRLLFCDAKFNGLVDFSYAECNEKPDFLRATFAKRSLFEQARFAKGANFAYAQFAKTVNFSSATFGGSTNFAGTVFSEDTNFHTTTFDGGGTFIDTVFHGTADFSGAEFLGRMLFASNDKKRPIFSGVEIDFRSIHIAPLDVLIIRDADLKRCKFQGTDLRKAEITGAHWPTTGGRSRVYDEVAPLPEGKTRSWPHIERLYRELKQNYEDRRDYERAGAFHYGEKEMRRQNPETSRGLRFWLKVYRCVSGYGERYWPPLLWAGVLLVVSTVCYVYCHLLHTKAVGPVVDPVLHWWDAGLYSLRAMTLLKPSYLEPVRPLGVLISTGQSLLGPVLLGLFAFALRQRLKR